MTQYAMIFHYESQRWERCNEGYNAIARTLSKFQELVHDQGLGKDSVEVTSHTPHFFLYANSLIRMFLL